MFTHTYRRRRLRPQLRSWKGRCAEVPATVHHAHEVEHPVEIALIADGYRRPPQLLDEGPLVRPRRRGQPAHGGRGHHAGQVARGERPAVRRVAVGEGADALADEELLDAVA